MAPARVHLAVESIELRSQTTAIREAGSVEPGVEREVRRSEILDRGIAGRKRRMADAQIGGTRHERLGRDADIVGHAVGADAAHSAGDHAQVGMFGNGG